MTKNIFPHCIVYIGFLTTMIAVPKDVFFIHRFAYVNIVVSIIYFILKKKLVINKQITLICLLSLMISFFLVFEGNANLYLVVRMFLGLMAMNLALYSYFKYYNYDYLILIRHYIIIAIASSYLGLVQEICYLIGFEPGYNIFGYLFGFNTQLTEELLFEVPIMRITSFFTEPGYFGSALSPAVFLSINHLVTGSKAYLKRREAIIILAAAVLTFSVLSYIGIAISLLLNLKWRIVTKSLISIIISLISIIIFITFSLLVISISSNIGARIYTLWEYFYEDRITGYENISALIFITNFKITQNNFLERPLIGSGLDSYKIVYQTSLENLQLSEGFGRFISFMNPEDMNYEEGGNMFFKIITELGIFGVCAVFWFIYSNRVKEKNTNYMLLQNMCLTFLMVYSLRTGQYIRFELWYFIFFYYSIKKYYDNNKGKFKWSFSEQVEGYRKVS